MKSRIYEASGIIKNQTPSSIIITISHKKRNALNIRAKCSYGSHSAIFFTQLTSPTALLAFQKKLKGPVAAFRDTRPAGFRENTG
jgi:hypothetical protein